MKTVTIEQFMTFNPCYDEKRIKRIAGRKKNWTALDVLVLDIPAQDKLWAVLREEFIDAPILHDFACLCAEEALKLIEKPDPRSVAAIKTKRKWLKGEATYQELSMLLGMLLGMRKSSCSLTCWKHKRLHNDIH